MRIIKQFDSISDSPAEFTHPMYGGPKYGGINMSEEISQPKLGTKCMNVHHEKMFFFVSKLTQDKPMTIPILDNKQ